jgi:hypothetical protein
MGRRMHHRSGCAIAVLVLRRGHDRARSGIGVEQPLTSAVDAPNEHCAHIPSPATLEPARPLGAGGA